MRFLARPLLSKLRANPIRSQFRAIFIKALRIDHKSVKQPDTSPIKVIGFGFYLAQLALLQPHSPL